MFRNLNNVLFQFCVFACLLFWFIEILKIKVK